MSSPARQDNINRHPGRDHWIVYTTSGFLELSTLTLLTLVYVDMQQGSLKIRQILVYFMAQLSWISAGVDYHDGQDSHAKDYDFGVTLTPTSTKKASNKEQVRISGILHKCNGLLETNKLHWMTHFLEGARISCLSQMPSLEQTTIHTLTTGSKWILSLYFRIVVVIINQALKLR